MKLGGKNYQREDNEESCKCFIICRSAPDYLCKLVPPTIQSTTIYPLRNGNDIIVPFCRLSLTSDSFIPSTIRCWNRLNPTIRA